MLLGEWEDEIGTTREFIKEDQANPVYNG